MTKVAETLLADALRCDAKTRATLAAELLASLDGPADANADSARAEEIERRVAALEAGTEALESLDESRRRIAREILVR